MQIQLIDTVDMASMYWSACGVCAQPYRLVTFSFSYSFFFFVKKMALLTN